MKVSVIAKRIVGRIQQLEIHLLADEKYEFLDGVDDQTELEQFEKLVANIQASQKLTIASAGPEDEITSNQVPVDVRSDKLSAIRQILNARDVVDSSKLAGIQQVLREDEKFAEVISAAFSKSREQYQEEARESRRK